MFLTSAKKSEDEINQIISSIEDTITKGKGANLNVTKWGERALAYPINNETKGFYVIVNFDSDGSGNKDIEKSIIGHDDIYRHILIRDEREKYAKKFKAKADRKAERKQREAARIAKEQPKIAEMVVEEKKPTPKKVVAEEKKTAPKTVVKKAKESTEGK